MYEQYFRNLTDNSQSIVARLRQISSNISTSLNDQGILHHITTYLQTINWFVEDDDYRQALVSFCELLTENKLLSPIDICSSGIVDILLTSVNISFNFNSSIFKDLFQLVKGDKELVKNRFKIFSEVFLNEDAPLRTLVRKLVAVLESIERLVEM